MGVCVDATVIRAHRARRRGAPGQRGPEAQGCRAARAAASSTKLHAATDARGNPLRLIGGPGQQGEVRRGAELLAGLAVGAAIADTAYDAEHFHDPLRQAGARAVIKPRPSPRKLHPLTRRSIGSATSSSASSRRSCVTQGTGGLTLGIDCGTRDCSRCRSRRSE